MAVCTSAAAASPPLVELKIGNRTTQGKIAAGCDQFYWLMEQDGRLSVHKTANDGKPRQVAGEFRCWTTSIVRDQLRREFAKPFDIAGTRHFVVCAKGEQKSRQYAETFEELFRTFQLYFSVRGFKIADPEFPLVAIVFPDYESFSRYARAEQVSASRNLRGYYLSTSNRVALYESEGDSTAALGPADAGMPSPWFRDPTLHGSVEARLKDTMIHEATHQVAFNTGLHSRIGRNPKWIEEGLATVFEAPGIRMSGANLGPKTRINPERFVWFGNFQKSRRKPQSLEEFIASDELFDTQALDAYSEAWAFTFFLIETRPRLYAEYLRLVASRDALRIYTAEDRVGDFKRAVSRDLNLLEAEFLRFIAGIK